ncbi:MAG: hypothetical protein IMZ43_08095 [Thermoplasmata archaeon]|nr:hypothetical protein [Thermoplasmata archaeon]
MSAASSHELDAAPDISNIDFSSKSVFTFDIGDEDSLAVAVDYVKSSLHECYYLGVVSEDEAPYGIVLYKRGTSGYYQKRIAPRIEELLDVSDKLGLIGYFGVLFTFTTDTKLFASQSAAWISMRENVNRILSWARKGASGKRKRVYHLPDGSERVFVNPRPAIRLYIRVPEDTEARYPAPHVLFFFCESDFTSLPMSKKAAVDLFNEELTCVCDEQGFTHISDFRHGFTDSSSAVTYCMKYIGKQMNPRNPGYDGSRGLTWMVCLRSVNCRMYSMSNMWRELYHKLHVVNEIRDDRVSHPHEGVDPVGRLGGLNNTVKCNSNVVSQVCYFFNEPFDSLSDFMDFFRDFLTSVEPPPLKPEHVIVGLIPVDSEKHSEMSVVDAVVPKVSTNFSEFTESESAGALVFDTPTVQMMMAFFDDASEDTEVVPYLFSHCKSCEHFSKCPRPRCRESVECLYCCYHNREFAEEDGCFLASEVFS